MLWSEWMESREAAVRKEDTGKAEGLHFAGWRKTVESRYVEPFGGT